jgi:hypothetical protein
LKPTNDSGANLELQELEAVLCGTCATVFTPGGSLARDVDWRNLEHELCPVCRLPLHGRLYLCTGHGIELERAINDTRKWITGMGY